MIRKAGTEDAAAIAQLSWRELGYDYPLEKTKQAAAISTETAEKIRFIFVAPFPS